MTTGDGHSRLFYYGTTNEVCIGDRVRIQRWLFGDRHGVVCYIPGLSRLHAELEYDDIQKWAIRLDDGTVLAMGYDPEDSYGQPRRDLVLVARGAHGELTPDEELN